ncbi:MAG: VOC family protein [Rhodospirillales bacterium]|nr:VOC family protein [Rhodospirillales bacterium]
MPKKIAPIPKGYRTITPELVVRGADQALAYYKDVFDAIVVSRVTADDGITVLQAEVKIGNSLIRIMDEMPAFGILSPTGIGGTAVGIHVYDAAAGDIWQRALAQGAGILIAFADTPWGERYGKFIDPFGHVWSVSHRIAKTQSKPATAVIPQAETEAAVVPSFSVHEPLADRTQPSPEQDLYLEASEALNSNAA